MTPHLEEELTASLRHRAERQVDTSRLIAGATARGQQLVYRRRATVAGLSLAVVLLGGGATPLAVGALGDSGRQGRADRVAASPEAAPAAAPTSDPGPRTVPMLPSAPLPDAARRVVGTDPAALHFAVEGVDTQVRAIQWHSGSDLEFMRMERLDGGLSWVTLSANQDVLAKEIRIRTGDYADAGTDETVDVRGVRGTLRTTPTNEGTSYLLSWQPEPGLYAHAHARAATEDEVWWLVDRLRLGIMQRCVVPFAPAKLPDGLKLTGCTVETSALAEPSAPAEGFRSAEITFSGKVPGQVRLAMRAGELKGSPETTVGGRPGLALPRPAPALSLYDDRGVMLDLSCTEGFTDAVLYEIGENLRVAAKLGDLAAWLPPVP